MCTKLPKPPVPKPPAPAEKPRLELGVDSPNTDLRLQRRRGRSQLRTSSGLAVGSGGAGLAIERP